MMEWKPWFTATAIMLVWVGQSTALTGAEKCGAAKLKVAGKYNFCRLKAEAKAIKSGAAVDYTKCDGAFGLKWEAAESGGGGMCPGDESTIAAFITQNTNDISAALSGGPLPDCPMDLATCNADLVVAQACGNGVVDAGEDCDLANLNGQTCATQGFAGGTLKCGSGCVFDTSGCTATRFVDNGDGTVTDTQTGLMWEKKNDVPVPPGSIHDKDNLYTWSAASGTSTDGSAFVNLISVLNGLTSSDGTTISGCFANHCDWRLPTVAELQSLLLAPYPCATHPCIDPIFGPTQPTSYWSCLTDDGSPGAPFYAWVVDFSDGNLFFNLKSNPAYVRAVRGNL